MGQWNFIHTILSTGSPPVTLDIKVNIYPVQSEVEGLFENWPWVGVYNSQFLWYTDHYSRYNRLSGIHVLRRTSPHLKRSSPTSLVTWKRKKCFNFATNEQCMNGRYFSTCPYRGDKLFTNNCRLQNTLLCVRRTHHRGTKLMPGEILLIQTYSNSEMWKTCALQVICIAHTNYLWFIQNKDHEKSWVGRESIITRFVVMRSTDIQTQRTKSEHL